MEKELNIAAILKDKPKGTRLWSPIFGDCLFDGIDSNIKDKVWVEYNSTYYSFGKEGKHFSDGEPMLFPSKEMRDWQKFAWKKGDVLCCGVDNLCIFNGWIDLDYTEFDAEFVTYNYSGAVLNTKDWSKETNETIIKQYISEIEEIKGGKLNLETLEVEHEYKPKQIKKHDFQPFDKVLVRNAKDEIWFPRLFAYEGDTYIVCTDGDDYQFCIPYNDQTKHLLGTTKDWEGGE